MLEAFLYVDRKYLSLRRLTEICMQQSRNMMSNLSAKIVTLENDLMEIRNI